MTIEDLEMLEEGMSQGFYEVLCRQCGEEHRLEPDGQCVCDCGAKVESPLVEMGMI